MYKCIGCDRPAPDLTRQEGKVVYYSCPCGGCIFYREDWTLYIPISILQALQGKAPFPHLDQILGNSLHTSDIKEAFTIALLEEGAIWMKDCEECRANGNLDKAYALEKFLAVQEAESILRRYR